MRDLARQLLDHLRRHLFPLLRFSEGFFLWSVLPPSPSSFPGFLIRACSKKSAPHFAERFHDAT
jgi:hypothetical protein